MKRDARVLIVGHDDLQENALSAHFQLHGYPHITAFSALPLDINDTASLQQAFQAQRWEYLILGSLRSGGIAVNQQFPADFMTANLRAELNLVEAAHTGGVKKILFLGSSCMYPRDASQPLREDDLFGGPLEKTSEAYAVARMAGMKLCQAYQRQYGMATVTMIPATVFGPGCNTDAEQGHVIGALLGKFHRAVRNGEDTVEVWGSGEAWREFLYTEDFAWAVVRLLEDDVPWDVVNAGFGQEISIRELAELIAEIVGFRGTIVFDAARPEGVARKLLDSSRLKQLNWSPQTDLAAGIRQTYAWMCSQ